ncbi:AAA family ATPase [Streptomyces virginiae]|uniref:AAA family ATPase n=1 Tax=Streptomyces virginiae TaxID=1961 RepID=UPI003255CF20
MVRALVAGVGSFSGPPPTEEEQADGVVGYEPLPAVAEAVRELASALERAGARTGEALVDCTRGEFFAAWERLQAEAGPDEPLIVHFTGHGVIAPSSGGLYLVAGDTAARPTATTAVSVGRLLEEAEDSGHRVLLLLDVCQAGQALVQQQLVELAARRRQGAPRRVLVIGACASDAITYGARFTGAAAEVLRRLADGELDLSPGQEYLPPGQLALEIERLLAPSGRPQDGLRTEVVRSPEVRAAPAVPPFLPNPAYGDGTPAGLLNGLDPRLREFALACSPGLDPLHFATRVAGDRTVTDILFSGRTDQLGRLRQWLGAAGDEPLLAITGGPGSGKSALAGTVVCLLHPELERIGDRVARHLDGFELRRPARVIAVHARQLTLRQITEALGTQLAGPKPAETGPRCEPESEPGPELPELSDLLTELRSAEDLLVVLDALDEAADPTETLHGLLLPLAEPGAPGCRVLIGTRPWWDSLPELHRHLTAHPAARLDLDPATDEDRAALAEDLDRYLRRLLPARLVPRTEVRTIADRLAQYSDHGAFLVAALYADHLLTAPERAPTGPPCSVTEVFELHLGSLAAQDPWVRPVLEVLGRARGHGLPLDLLHATALAHRPPEAGRPGPRLADTRRVLGKAAFYLRTTSGPDHRMQYRYFHQALADHTLPRTDSAVFHQALTNGQHITPDWTGAHPYLLRHAAEHALDAGGTALDELIADPAYLLAADPDRLTPLLHRARGDRARLHVDVYRATTANHPWRHRLEARRSLLALDAASRSAPDLARTLSDLPAPDPGRPVPVWATRRQHPALLHTLQGHRNAIRALATAARPDGSPIAVTASRDATAIVWDLETGTPLQTLQGVYGELLAVAVVAGPDDTLRVVAGGEDQQVMVWDPDTGRTVHRLDGHRRIISSAAAALAPDGRMIAVTGDMGGVAKAWDLATGAMLSEVRVPSYRDRTTVLLATTPGGELYAVASAAGPLAAWDPLTGARLHTWDEDGNLMEPTALATTPDGGRLLASVSVGTVVLDMTTGERLHELTGHRYDVAAVATAQTPGGVIAATAGTDGVVKVWDLDSGECLHTLAGHTDELTAVLFTETPQDGLLLFSAGWDGVVMVWDVATGTRRDVLTGHRSWVARLAVAARRDGTPVVVSTASYTPIVWDPAPGARTPTLPGHSASVSGVVAVTPPDGPAPGSRTPWSTTGALGTADVTP